MQFGKSRPIFKILSQQVSAVNLQQNPIIPYFTLYLKGIAAQLYKLKCSNFAILLSQLMFMAECKYSAPAH